MATGQAADVPAKGSRLKPLGRRFFGRPSPVVARDLLGRLLVRRLGEVLLVGRIVETEAYQEDDPASHSYRGPTPRTEVMFGPPGRLYVYFTYGMHYCMNVVTGKEGEGSAVLLRAAEPMEGLEAMATRRGVVDRRRLCSGPARLAEAFGVDREQNGLDLVEGAAMWIGPGRRVPDERVAAGPRIGIRRAADVPWRFLDAASPFVSPGRPGRAVPSRSRSRPGGARAPATIRRDGLDPGDEAG